MKKLYSLLLLIITVAFSTKMLAQDIQILDDVVDPVVPADPDQFPIPGDYGDIQFLIEDILVDFDNNDGITSIDNITVTYGELGTNGQIGYFYDGASNIGFSDGFVLSTGGLSAITPTGFGTNSPDDSPGAQDADLVQALTEAGASSNTINNVVIVEFDFTANYQDMQFEYVFASDEYPGFTCSQFNDIFGFFLSGPGITGPYTAGAENLATVPGTDTPVLINTINSGVPSGGNPAPCDNIDPNWQSYSTYFVDYQTVGGNEVGFPGFTVPLVAQSPIQCDEVYHIKLAIADVADQALNSAVFLLANSFQSPVNVTVVTDYDVVTPDGSDSVYEGCGNVTMTVIRPEDAEWQGDFTAFYGVGGTATPGDDYLVNGTIPSGEIFFPAGVNTVIFNFDIALDDIIEGDETIIFTFEEWTGNACDESSIVEVIIDVADHQPLELELPEQLVANCPGDEVILNAEISGGIPFPIDIPQGQLEPYFEIEWEHIGTNLVQPVYPMETTDYVIRVEDVCGDFIQDTVTVVVREWDELRILELLPDSLCLYDQGRLELLSENVVGGDGNYTYSWSTGAEGPVLEDFPGTFTVKVTDGCGQTATATSEIVDYSLPEIVFEPFRGDDPLSIAFENFTVDNGDMLYVWNYGDGTKLDTIYKPETHLYPNYGEYVASLTVTNSLGCEDVISKRIIIEPPYYAPTAFTPNGDGVNEGFKVHALGATSYSLVIYDRWGKEVFSSSNPDQEWFGFMKDGVQAEAGIYVYRVKMRIRGFVEPIFEEGSVTLLR